MRAVAVLAASLAIIACGDAAGSACEAARNTMIDAMKAICGVPGRNGSIADGDKGYVDSKFCRRCVDAEYYSTTGASACQCVHLTFDAASCAFETNDNAKAQVRSAIDWADSVCADFTPPAAIPPQTSDDAGNKASSVDGATP
jgi:hypothetical protein